VRGVWRERMVADGAFLDQPAPATSLYHVAAAMLDAVRSAPA
jgi:mannose/cellobiose epimerase-like protein (N-acyl-D-glucosamine 2-epimerase family)